MKKIRDFIYNTNDIIIALLIIVIAAGVILWRFGVILQYPKTLIGDESQIGTSLDDMDRTNTETGADIEDEQTGDETGDDVGNVTPPEEQGPIWKDGKLTRDIEVHVGGNTATAAIQCLVDAGIFEDYAEYKDLCKEMGRNDEWVAGGMFTFKEGATKNDIIKAVNISK